MSTINVKFSQNHNVDFYKELKSRVNQYFKTTGKSRYGNVSMYVKTVFMFALYLVPFILMLTVVESTWLFYCMWFVMGLGMAGIGLSVMHDANHYAYSKNPFVNKIMSHVLTLLGGSDVNWRIQHNVLHHTYTNVTGLDEDINPGIIMRFSPHEKRRAIHKYQHLYAWFLYSLMTVSWAITKDFRQIHRYSKMGLLETQKITLGRAIVMLVISKVIYFAIVFGLPLIFSPFAWYQLILGFIVMQLICGFILGIIFQPAHVVPTSNFPIPDNSGNIEADWAVSQLLNTSNFAPKSKLFSWYVGGLNFQVEHHLFPNICHIHYKKISEIVKQTAEDFNLPYFSEKTFLNALSSHAKMLYNLGHYDDAVGFSH